MADLREIIISITGATGRALDAATTNTVVRPVFFQPYTSPGDFAMRGVSVVTAPVYFGVGSCVLFLHTGWILLRAIAQAIGSNFSVSSGDERYAGAILEDIQPGFGLIVLAMISPFVNLIDWIISGINSVRNAINPEENNYQAHAL